VGRQGGHGGDQLVADGFGGAPVGQVDEHHVAGGALDEGADRRRAVGADDQVAFPVPGHGPVADVGRALTDHDHRVADPGRAGGGVAARRAAGAPGAQRGSDITAQTAAGLQVESLVDTAATARIETPPARRSAICSRSINVRNRGLSTFSSGGGTCWVIVPRA
jgi:hypothetical protein